MVSSQGSPTSPTLFLTKSRLFMHPPFMYGMLLIILMTTGIDYASTRLWKIRYKRYIQHQEQKTRYLFVTGDPINKEEREMKEKLQRRWKRNKERREKRK